MSVLEAFSWSIAVWSCAEGTFIIAFPKAATTLGRRLFPKWGSVLSQYSKGDLRKLGAVEFGFGLVLSLFLKWVY